MSFFVLMFALAAVIFNLTLPIMAGVYIVSDLGGSSFLSAYGVCFFCLGNAITVPLGKPTMMPLKPIQMLLSCLVLMALISWECATATDYLNFIFFRFLEGLASGPLYLLISVTLFPRVISPERQSRLLPYLFIVFSFTPVLGASWGGWIAYSYHWRFLFFSNIPICVFLIAYALMEFDDEEQNAPIAFDGLGYAWYAMMIFCLGTALITGQELDWFRSNLIGFLFIAGTLCTVLFVVESLNSPSPVMDLRMFGNFYFSFAMINIAILFMIYFGMVILLALWLKLYVNYTPNWIALIIGTMAFGAWIPVLLHHKPMDPRIPLAIALLFFCISSFYTMTFNVEINFNRIAFSRILAGFGLALFLPPLFRISVQNFSGKYSVEAINTFHIIRLVSSGIGAALFIILWQRRQVFYYERLGSKLTVFSQSTQTFFKQAGQINLYGEKALAQLNVYLTRQATALALDDCFYLMGWISLGLLLMLALSIYPLKRRFELPFRSKDAANA
ncbi:MFS transporter [Legionella jordanis]|uniref:Multidrug resistance protein, MFS superfamily n=1 Tax=Legionella jordanis TaxID=456 RepID=A0A0W0VBG7_9GAMM|nr:MFS transporter [Legionella jordanis]KTD17474.1 multidrug resistance protein, MFS superfamily [Legionella jordanis]RMX05186.1 MFS transporter [Legionella jordanis]RMX17442.1 MFS transporter [Legionella jordanis]VEH13443.1 multidrug resistance protein, MFS superfamily [Legionella jordanis]